MFNPSPELFRKLIDNSHAQSIRQVQDLLLHGVVSGNLAGPISMQSRHDFFCRQIEMVAANQPERGFLENQFVRGNKIRLSPKNENVKDKILSKCQKSVSFPSDKILVP